ncbi:hypothetical protein RBB50_003771 [Rhinocladiella similis]
MAAIAPSQSLSSDSNNAGYSKTTRRQYQSCDQCRKSRRACDAGALRVVNFPLNDEDAINLPDSTCEACSNCTRTGKKCTFEWLHSLPRQGLPKGIKRKLESSVVAPESTTFLLDTAREAKTEQPYNADSLSLQYASRPSRSIPPGERHTSGHHHHSNGHAPVASTLPHLPSPDSSNGSPKSKHPHALHNNHHNSSRTLSNSSRQDFRSRKDSSSDFHPPALRGFDTSTSSASYDSIFSRERNALSHSSDSSISASSDSGPDNERGKSQKRNQHGGTAFGVKQSDESSLLSNSTRRASTGSTTLSGNRRQSSSPLMNRGQVRFADGAMKAMIASGLLRIYHDSFENSLSCWVTEQNCPYETELTDLIAKAGPGTTAEEAALRLGDNRIFSRVSRLDSAFTHLRGRQLSAKENKAASNALNSAIMAFASQWSHSSHNAFWRSKEGLSRMKAWQQHSNTLLPHSTRPNESPVSTDFERMIQKTLWHEARKAIQDTTEIDSFKVILAYMLFALTQRPPDESPKPRTDSTRDAPFSSNNNSNMNRQQSFGREYPISAHSSFSPAAATAETEWDPFQTTELEGLASPPVYLETAVRNLFSWRRKVERYRRMSSAHQNDANPTPKLALKDQQTFNMLFWLGVMCDTTSSAITRRPLVIPDEDCAMIRESLEKLSLSEGQQPNEQLPCTSCPACASFPTSSHDHHHPHGSTTAPLWDTYLLTFTPARTHTDPFSLPSPARWPCSFEQAAQILQEAIPVKVLMFRRVAHLQTLASRRASPSSLEATITAALDVYSHWNRTYLPFMDDCVSSHNALPPHVQSWYVILDGHWHYGCLLLADTISQIDAEQRTLQIQRDLRRKYGLLAELRRDNARAIARIADASLSEHGPVFPNNPEFHFACNGSAILTEPWTDVLVRAMGSACRIFINWIKSYDRPADPMHRWVRDNTTLANLYTQADVCIQGMALLGRKSDAANYTAEVFWKKLKEVCGGGGGDFNTVNATAANAADANTNTFSSHCPPRTDFNVRMKTETTW